MISCNPLIFRAREQMSSFVIRYIINSSHFRNMLSWVILSLISSLDINLKISFYLLYSMCLTINQFKISKKYTHAIHVNREYQKWRIPISGKVIFACSPFNTWILNFCISSCVLVLLNRKFQIDLRTNTCMYKCKFAFTIFFSQFKPIK